MKDVKPPFGTRKTEVIGRIPTCLRAGLKMVGDGILGSYLIVIKEISLQFKEMQGAAQFSSSFFLLFNSP